jgi:hypothetical protein
MRESHAGKTFGTAFQNEGPEVPGVPEMKTPPQDCSVCHNRATRDGACLKLSAFLRFTSIVDWLPRSWRANNICIW